MAIPGFSNFWSDSEEWGTPIGVIPMMSVHERDSHEAVGAHLTPWVPMVRVTDSPVWFGNVPTYKTWFFIRPSGLACLRRVGKALGRDALHSAPSVFFLFSKAVGGGSESWDPHMPAQGGGRRIVAGLRQRHPLGLEGSASLLLSGLCRLRARSPPRKHCRLRVCGLRVHTRTKHNTHSVRHSLTHSPH